MAKRELEAATPGPLDAELADALAMLTDPMLTVEGFGKRVLQQIAAMPVPDPAKLASLKFELREYIKKGQIYRPQSNHESLRQATLELYKSACALTKPPPVTTPADWIAQAHSGLQNCGLGSMLIDHLRVELTLEDLPIRTYNAHQIVTATRTIEWEALIVSYRPRSMTPDKYHQWREQHLRPAHLADRSSETNSTTTVIHR